MAQESSFRDIQVTSIEIGIRKIRVEDLWQSLKEGYDDFNTMPSFGVFLVVIYPLAALLLTLLLLGKSPLYLVFPMVAGLSLIGPVVSFFAFPSASARTLSPGNTRSIGAGKPPTDVRTMSSISNMQCRCPSDCRAACRDE